MRIKYYFAKDFESSDTHEIESLRTHYYRSRKEDAIENVKKMAALFKAKVKSVDIERGEIVFDSLDFQASAFITATSYTEMAIDFIVSTYNVLPTAKGKRVIEAFYVYLDKNMDFKGISLYRR